MGRESFIRFVFWAREGRETEAGFFLGEFFFLINFPLLVSFGGGRRRSDAGEDRREETSGMKDGNEIPSIRAVRLLSVRLLLQAEIGRRWSLRRCASAIRIG